MKIPDYYIDDLNDIIEIVDKLNARDLFRAYKQILFIKDGFDRFGVSLEDANYKRLLKVENHVDLLLIKKLAELDTLQKVVDNYYASKP